MVKKHDFLLLNHLFIVIQGGHVFWKQLSLTGDRKMDKYFEKLVQNVQKGEFYSVKLKNDPQVYMAIPMIPARYQNDEPARFLLKVIAPEKNKGVFEYNIDEIEWLEKRV